jgi:hypothetical protein
MIQDKAPRADNVRPFYRDRNAVLDHLSSFLLVGRAAPVRGPAPSGMGGRHALRAQASGLAETITLTMPEH